MCVLRSGHRRALKITWITQKFSKIGGGRRYKKSSFLNDFPHARTVRTSTKTTTTTSTYLEGQRNIAAVWPRGALLKCHKVQHQLNHTSSERKWGGILCGCNNKNAATVFPFHTCSKVHQSNSFSWLFPHSFHESFANHGPGPPIVWLTCIFFLSLVFFFLKPPSRSLHLSPPSCRVCIWASS